MLGLTMQHVAMIVGVTYQQLYKYECGTNRIAAARLHRIARALDVDMGYFFANIAAKEQSAVTQARRQLLELTRNFIAIPSRRQQEALCGLTRAIAAADMADNSSHPTVSAEPSGPRRALSSGADAATLRMPASAA